MMNAVEVNKWIEALRSGKYRQGKGALAMKDKSKHATYCCLGVACLINGLEKKFNKLTGEFTFDDETSILPDSIAQLLGADGRDMRVPVTPLILDIALKNGKAITSNKEDVALSGLNDDSNFTFRQIADVLEEALENEQKRRMPNVAK